MRGLILLAVLLIIAGCGTPEPVCKSPYIQVGVDCCLDANSNSVCDSDEPVPEPVVEGVLCESDWKCSEWSDCSNDGLETRVCRDLNDCGVPPPDEERECTPPCDPDWSCGEWGDCVQGRQTRECVDANSCGSVVGKPNDSRSCEMIEEPETINMYGSDDLTTRTFRLEKGLAIFDMLYEGDDFFTVELEDEGGSHISLLANTVGGFEGRRAWGIVRPGLYKLVVDTNGRWEFAINQPRNLLSTDPDEYSGSGIGVTDSFGLDGEAYDVSIKHDGVKDFEVRLLDSEGNPVQTLVDDKGAFDDSFIVQVDKGTYLIDVVADGDWSIGFSR